MKKNFKSHEAVWSAEILQGFKAKGENLNFFRAKHFAQLFV